MYGTWLNNRSQSRESCALVSASTIITGFAIPLTFRATQDREQLFHDFAKRSKKHLILAIRESQTLPFPSARSLWPWIDRSLRARYSEAWHVRSTWSIRAKSTESRANCRSVAEEDYTLACRRVARAAPKRVIVADIYTSVTLPARLRDFAQDLSMDPWVSRPAIK